MMLLLLVSLMAHGMVHEFKVDGFSLFDITCTYVKYYLCIILDPKLLVSHEFSSICYYAYEVCWKSKNLDASTTTGTVDVRFGLSACAVCT